MQENYRVRRVGAITAGLSLIMFGTMFCVSTFTGYISYAWIFRFWPLILMGMGAEILLSCRSEKRYVYDKGAVVLLVILAFLACMLAGIDVVYNMCGQYLLK